MLAAVGGQGAFEMEGGGNIGAWTELPLEGSSVIMGNTSVSWVDIDISEIPPQSSGELVCGDMDTAGGGSIGASVEKDSNAFKSL